MADLSPKQRIALEGLSHGRAYLSASERGDPEIMELLKRNLASAYMAMGGLVIWEIAPAGRAALAADQGETK